MVDDLLKRTPLLVANLEIYGCRQLRVTRRDALFLPVLPGHRRDLEMRLRERSDAKPENVTQRLRKGIWESAIIKAGEFGEPIVNYNGCLAATVDALVARIQPHVVSL
jgi:guanylate kinase